MDQMENSPVYAFALDLHKRINAGIDGRVCMYPMELAGLLYAIHSAGDGDHLEIGTMWGATAIAAALLKEEYGLEGKVVVVDPFSDMDAESMRKPSADTFWANAERFKVQHRLELVQKYSAPWPLDDHFFASALIDGDHRAPWPLTDWENVKEHAGVVIFHDYIEREAAVFETVTRVMNDPAWDVLIVAERTAAFRCKNNA